MKLIYEFFRVFGIITGFPFYWLFFRTKVFYKSTNAPRRIRGGALIISNHFNAIDYMHNAFFLFPRKLNVVASEMAFKDPLITLGMKFWGGILADRNTRDMSFISKSAALINKGKLVQIFPEGHNTEDGYIQRFYPSYLLIALKTSSPIIPIISDGSYSFKKRTHVMVGDPIYIEDLFESPNPGKEEISRVNDIIRQIAVDMHAELLELKKQK